MRRGFSLLETLIGISLLLIVFVGILGAVYMGMQRVGQSKARVTAVALANQKIELARNLPYEQVGTSGGIPSGSIPENETVTKNKIVYAVKTTVFYMDDPFDGLGSEDPLPTDYKRVKVKVSWSGNLSGEISFQTDIAPKGIETTGSGGIISILVFDANGQPVSQADIELENNVVVPSVHAHYQTDNQGRLFIPGAPACSDCYKITATKSGYSTDRTYAVGEQIRGTAIAVPNKPLLSVIEGDTSEISFSIDRLATKNVQTIKYLEEKNQSTNPVVPIDLDSWKELSWTSTSTDIHFQLLYNTGTDWLLIPGADFTVSPADISWIDSFQYPSVMVQSNEPSDWQINWLSTDTTTPVPNISFAMKGTKTVGLDSGGQPIYKYQNNFNTDINGQKIISDLEWDTYRITINGSATGYDIANSSPYQPVNINPDSSQTTVLKLFGHQTNTVLLNVQDSAGQPLTGAHVRLYRTGYNKEKLTTDSGQAFFSPLASDTYNIEAGMAGYQDWSGQIDVSGQSSQIIILTQP